MGRRLGEVYDATEAANALKRILGPKFVSFLLARVGARVEEDRVLMDYRALRAFAESVARVLGARLARDVLSLVKGIPEDLIPRMERPAQQRGRPAGPRARVGVAPERELEEASRRFDDVIWLSNIIFRMKLRGIRKIRLPGGQGNIEALAAAAAEEGIKSAYLVVRQGDRLARVIIEDAVVRAAFYQDRGGKFFGSGALEKIASMTGEASVEVISLEQG